MINKENTPKYNPLKNYQIDSSLFDTSFNYQEIYTNEDKSTIEEIKKAINHIIPSNGGHELIRIGGHGDGGYLVPNDLVGIEVCFSPGVNNFKNFEDQLAEEFNIKSFMCDFSSDITQLRTPLIEGMQFFEKKWLDITPDEKNLDINDWVLSNSPIGADFMLQMDIEGAEYRNILNATAETLSRFRVIILELHGLHELSDSRYLRGVFLPTISKLASLFTCVHVHPNNCCPSAKFSDDLIIPSVLELTFLRKDRLRKTKAPLLLPHPLDELNVLQKPPLSLEGCWLKNADVTRSEIAALRQSVVWFEKKVIDLTKSNENNFELSALKANTEQITNYLIGICEAQNNIAIGKTATQSSLSSFSSAEGANGAINGNKTGEFGFHTELEDNPWWMVDLGRVFDLTSIIIFNRLDSCSDRVVTLKVSLSMDGLNWILIYDHQGRPAFGGIKPLNGRPALFIACRNSNARFVKLECVGKTILHLDEVEIFGIAK